MMGPDQEVDRNEMPREDRRELGGACTAGGCKRHGKAEKIAASDLQASSRWEIQADFTPYRTYAWESK